MTAANEHLESLRRGGFAFVRAAEFQQLLMVRGRGCPLPNPPPATEGGDVDDPISTLSNSLPRDSGGGLGWRHLPDWRSFAASWNDLGLDTYMADGGRYRRRRFGAFAVSPHEVVRKPHQPHYQSRDYNTLNGGIERWFEPLTDAIASHPLLLGCLRMCCSTFDALTPSAPLVWHTEVHQFRIDARPDEVGQPTPEGLHRDGVDWVLVLLVARENIAEGVTTIYDLAKQPLGSFTLTQPLDAAFVDDSRVYHGVTAVAPLDSTHPGYRDVLVVTFRRS